MKILKIGSGSKCDIKLDSEYVSAYHAELLIMDNGELLLTDKDSRNGTFVKNKKISPNVEVSIKRGDLIRFADSELIWAYVPAAEDLSKYKSVVNIGSNMLNNVVVNSALVSRFHAVLKVDKKGKAFLFDNDSTNGTQVNGVKIQSGKSVQIKRGDNIIVGGEDITQLLQPYLPNMLVGVKKIGFGAGLAAVLIACIIALCNILGDGPSKRFGDWFKPWSELYKPASVYVYAGYHYNIQFEDSPIHTDLWDGILKDATKPMLYNASAFFIDREGRLATNRHVAAPWEYEDPNLVKSIRTDVEKFIDTAIPDQFPYSNQAQEILNYYNNQGSPFWEAIKAQAKRDNNGQLTISGLNNVIRQLKKAKYKLVGEMDFIRIGYSGRMYTHIDELERCFVLTESGSNDKDIALLQLNTKLTPERIEYVFNPEFYQTEKLVPQADELEWIGYPRGTLLNLDSSINSMEPNIRNTRCSRPQGKYSFEFQGESLGGASGSPIYDKKSGKLVGVLWGGWRVGATFGLACQAKYLKEMYEEEVGL